MSIEKDELMDEEVIVKDDEIKEMFDKEFDLADITVSEELIAKTMTAIRGLSDTDTTGLNITKSYNTEPDKASSDTTTSDKVVNISKRTKVIKMVSGLAAALFVGFVVFTFVKLGVGGITKSEEKAAESSSSSYSTAQSNSASATESYRGDETAAPNSLCEDAEYLGDKPAESKYGADEAPSVAIVDGDSKNPQISAGSVTQNVEDDGNTDTVDREKDGSLKTENSISYLNPDIKDIDDVKEYISKESDKLTDSMNMLIAPMKKNDSVIRSSDIYGEVTYEINPVTEEALYALLKDSKDDPTKEYIYAVMLQDVSGINFTDENSENTWDTGKDYLKLYESAIADR